jgi:hypothetical protein
MAWEAGISASDSANCCDGPLRQGGEDERLFLRRGLAPPQRTRVPMAKYGFVQRAVMRAWLPAIGRRVHSCTLFMMRYKSELYLPDDRQVMYDGCEPSPERAEVLEIIDGQFAHGGLSKLSIFHVNCPLRSSEWKADC